MGALNSVSAVTRSLPGMCEILKLNCTNLILRCSILGGISSRFFDPKVCDQFQHGNSDNHSRPHVAADASFSICAYFLSVSIKDLVINTTGIHVSGLELHQLTWQCKKIFLEIDHQILEEFWIRHTLIIACKRLVHVKRCCISNAHYEHATLTH